MAVTDGTSNGYHALPRNQTAERAALGSILRDNKLLIGPLSRLRPEHFGGNAERLVFRVIRERADKGAETDIVILGAHLHQRGQLEDLPGGLAFLPQLLDAATGAHADEFAEIIIQQYKRRRVLLLAQQLLADSVERPMDELLREAQSELSAIAAGQSTTGQQLDEVNAAELAVSVADLHLDYLPLLGQEGYLVRGWSHLIASYPRAGKTDLLTACCRDWLAIGEHVLYLTEEPRDVWIHRLSTAPNAWQGMQVVFGLGADPAQLIARAKGGQENIVIIDTIRNLGLAGQDENDNTALARHIGPWVCAMRQAHKTPFFLHHSRKGGGKHGEAIAGGHALLGAVDIALELDRDDGGMANRRVLRASARIIQPRPLVYERQENGTMRVLGTPEAVGLGDVRRRVVEAVESDWSKTAEVRGRMDDPKPSMQQLRNALRLEARAGTIERDPPISEDAERKTHRWRKGGPGNLLCTPYGPLVCSAD
jgi:hypothetical protein